MRIAIFSDSFYPELGGIQDSIALVAKKLGERGHTVLFYAPRASARNFQVAGKPVAELDLGPNVDIRRCASFGVPSPTMQSRFVPPVPWRLQALREFNPDIIHTQTFFGLGWEATRAARKLQVPLVGTNHSAVAAFYHYAPFHSKAIAMQAMRLVTRYYNHCNVVTGPSQSIIDEMRAAGLEAPAEVVSNPIDGETFRPCSPEERTALKKRLGFSDAVIVYGGRFAVEKNVDVLVRALPLVRKKLPAAELVLAGHGSEEARLRSLAQELGVGDAARFVGTLSQPALAEVFSASEVFATASTSETQGMTHLQAMSCGLPVVAADSLSLKEYVPAQTGLHATPGSPEDFASKLLSILQDTQARGQMAKGALRFASQFSTEHIVDTWEEIYARVAARN